MGWTSIYQLFWGSLGTRVLTHPHICMYVCVEYVWPIDQMMTLLATQGMNTGCTSSVFCWQTWHWKIHENPSVYADCHLWNNIFIHDISYIYIIYIYILYFTYPFKSTRNRGLYLHWFYDGNGKFPINGGVNGPIIYKRWFSMFDSRKVCMMSCPSNIGGFAVNNWSRPGCSERQGTEWGMVRSWRSLVFL